ncbi:hypothetical protein IFM89_004824 [Coptis chinensis]|uniref:Uncharacterized protein n=1 Tax=Coptis chinensis TaxID=261450 RepID=A0A835LEF0_9MAGN|nr:hypothetical protein IFM89_004824 [Coptis chinensis]
MCSYFSPYPFVSFLFIIIFFHDFPFSFGEDDYTFLNCSRGVFECGDVKNIGYPFWGKGRAQYCGHPDFELKCEEDEDDAIQIVIQGQNYRVLNIFENNHTLRMRTMNPVKNNCPARLPNISLPNNLFNYAAPFNQNITLLYDCPSSIPQLIGNTIPCLTNDTTTSYYSIDSQNIPLPRNVWSCSTVVKVPILQAIVTTYTELLQSMLGGFDVTYVVPNNSECIQCENTRGQCGYDRGMQPTCFCSDGPYQGNCTNKPPDTRVGHSSSLPMKTNRA